MTTASNVLQELEWRGFVQQATPGLAAHFAKGPVTAYCGFDPTAPSLQLGNLMPLMLLTNLQRGRHRPIVLMGGGTGLIGDPSGKAGERPLLSKEQIRDNLQHQRDQMARFLEFGAGPTAAILLDNAKWLGSQGLIDFLRDVGKHFTVNVMLQKESVKARLEAGLSFTEFSYMLLQAYDFLHLFRERQCTLQVGGSDQWGNITAGVDLIRRIENVDAHGLGLLRVCEPRVDDDSPAGQIHLPDARLDEGQRRAGVELEHVVPRVLEYLPHPSEQTAATLLFDAETDELEDVELVLVREARQRRARDGELGAALDVPVEPDHRPAAGAVA